MPKAVLAKLIIEHSGNDHNAIQLHVATPTPLEEKNLGKLFAVFEFENPQRFNEELATIINNNFSKAFYYSSEFDVEATFERALQRVNKVVQEAISSYGEEWLYSTNMLLGVVHTNQVFFAYVGSMEAFLIQDNNIIRVIEHTQDEIKPLKLFNNIVAGQCPAKSSLLFCTTNLLDYLSQEKIRRTIKEHTPEQAVQYLEDILTEQTTLSNIVGLILSVESPGAVATNPAEHDNRLKRISLNQPGDSMSKLINQERATDDLLTPSIWPTLKKQLKTLKQRSDSAVVPEETQATTKIDYWGVGKTILNYLWKFLIILQHGLIYLIGTLVKLGHFLIRDRRSLRHLPIKVKGRLQRLSTARKLLLVVFIGAALFFVISLLWKNRSVEQAEQVKNWDNTLAQIENLVGETESKQIIADNSGARTSLAKADELLNTIPTASKAYAQRGQPLRDKITNLNNTLNKVTVVSNLSTIGNFSAANLEATVGHIEKIGEYIYGFDKSNQSVYRINLSDGTASQIINDTSNTSYQATINDSAATTLALLSNNKLVQFNPILEKTSPVTIDVLPDNASIGDIKLFGTRLYLFDTANKQIYRQQRSGDEYDSSTNWLKDGTDISTATDFTIDASIYVLLQSGDVLKLDDGKKSQFTMEAVTPNLAGATKLVKSSPESKFYIMNPTTKRIIVFSSKGALEQQLTSDQFNQLTDIVMDESTNTIYILVNNQLYKLPLQ